MQDRRKKEDDRYERALEVPGEEEGEFELAVKIPDPKGNLGDVVVEDMAGEVAVVRDT